jgi:chromosomal replication initiator protein
MTYFSAPGIMGTFPMTIGYITKKVFSTCGISLSMLNSKTRKTEVVQARQISMYFSRTMIKPKKSVNIIGKEIGNKSHGNVSHAIKTINNLIETDKKFKAHIDKIEWILQNNLPIAID